MSLVARIWGGEGVEVGAALCRLWVQAVHRLHSEETIVFLRILGRSDLADYQVSSAQPEAADLGLGDIDIFRPREEVIGAQKTDPLLDYLQDPSAEDVPHLLRLSTQQADDEILFLDPAIAGDLLFLGHLPQFT